MIRSAGNGAPRVLLITRNFPPFRGGMERLNQRMFQYVHAAEPTSALVGPVGCGQHVPEGAAVMELAAGSLPATLISSMTRGIAMARRIRPHVVLAGSGLAAPAAVLAARACGAMPAVYLHGLDIIAPSHIYRLAWLPFIRRCQHVIANSANTRRLAIEAGVESARIRVVHPGTDLPPADSSARARFRARIGVGDDTPVLLSVGRLTERKGLAEFVDRCLMQLLETHAGLKLVVIGDEAPHALHRGEGGGIGRVQDAAIGRGVSSAIQWLGPCSEGDLADAYQGADLHVFPVRDTLGDVEGFGMVAIEAAAHGLRTVAFDVGGVSDAVIVGASGNLVTPGDYDGFAARILENLARNKPDDAQRARAAMGGFSWERFGREVLETLMAP